MNELVDPLTGVCAPAVLRQRANWLLSRRIADQLPFGVLHLDISKFAQVNRIHGVSIGDAILVMAADRMQTCIRPSDLVGRLGNDEFQLIFNDGVRSLTDLSAMVDRVVASVNEPYEVAGLLVEIRFDAAALLIGSPHPELEEIFTRLDQALESAKSESRIPIELF
ncbi:MAG TPA: GGDEF domain-containing protein [Candidatus Nanopelagicaceae bacterium]|nr:GGDEF domain-containing protein [Candidatus Nanopelagicaceae bacterium]